MKVNLKTAAYIAIALLVIGFVFVSWRGNVNYRHYLEARGAADTLRAQYKDAVAVATQEIAALRTSNAAIEKQKQAALDDAATERAARTRADSSLAAERAKTQALTNDALATAICARIGVGNALATAGGPFSFTRPGTENTLNRFLDGETAVIQRDSAIEEAARNKDALTFCEDQRQNDAAIIKSTKAEGEKAAAWAVQERDARLHLERSLFGRTVKTVVIAIVLERAVEYVLRLVKVIK